MLFSINSLIDSNFSHHNTSNIYGFGYKVDKEYLLFQFVRIKKEQKW